MRSSSKSAAVVQASNAMSAAKNNHKKTGRQTNNSLSSVMDVKDVKDTKDTKDAKDAKDAKDTKDAKDAKDLKDVPSLSPRENGSKYRRIAPP